MDIENHVFSLSGEAANWLGTEEFRILNRWLGWGDPMRGVWFIGVEEGTSWAGKNSTRTVDSARQEIKERIETDVRSGGFGTRQSKNPKGVVATVTAKIASRLATTPINWRTYRLHHLWYPGSGVFNTNLFPLGKKRLSMAAWPKEYVELFGIDTSQLHAYRVQVRVTRFPLIRNAIADHQPQAVICYGKSCWPDFQELFGLGDHTLVRGAIDSQVSQLHKKGNLLVMLTRHFSNGFPDAEAYRVAKVLKNAGVRIDVSDDKIVV